MSWENLIKDQGILFGDHFITSHNLISSHCMDIIKEKTDVDLYWDLKG